MDLKLRPLAERHPESGEEIRALQRQAESYHILLTQYSHLKQELADIRKSLVMSDHSMKYQRDEARAEAERALASVRDLAEQVAELSARALAAEKERDETRRQLDKFMSSTAAHNIRAMKAESALSEALAALRSIAEGASGYRAGGGYFCDWCGENGHEGHAKQHPKRCPRTAARAVLDKLGVSDGR